MKTIQPPELLTTTKVIKLQGKNHLCISVQLAMPLIGSNEPLLQPDFISETEEALLDQVMDEGNPKPVGEYYVFGKVQSPNNVPVQSIEASVSVSDNHKTLRFSGERYWVGGLTGYTDPLPFHELPLNWSKSFGGKESKINPLGMGMEPVSNEIGKNLYPLAQIEATNEFPDKSRKAMTPVNFSPLEFEFPERLKHMGTYNTHWEKHRSPFLPDDFDLLGFNRAPIDQRLKNSNSENAFFQGGEFFELIHFNSVHPKISGRVPAYRVRIFYVDDDCEPEDIKVEHLKEVELRLDTLAFCPNELAYNMTYRALTPCSTPDGSHIQTLLACYENQSDTPRDKSHYHVSLVGRIHEQYKDIFEHSTQDLIPENHVCAFARIDEEAPPSPGELQGLQVSRKMSVISAVIEEEAQAKQSEMAELTAKHNLEPLEQKRDSKRDELQAHVDEAWDRINNGKPPKHHSLDPRLLDDGAWEAYDKAQKALDEHDTAVITELLVNQKQNLQETASSIPADGQDSIQDSILQLEEAIQALNTERLPTLPRPSVDLEIIQSMENAKLNTESLMEKNDLEQPAQSITDADIEDTKHSLEQIADSDRENYRLNAHEQPWSELSDSRSTDERMNEFWYRVEHGESHANCDYAGLDFSNMNLSGLDLCNCYLEQCIFDDANLTFTKLDNSVLVRSQFNNTDLSHSSLKGTNIGASNLTQSILDYSDMADCIIEDTILSEASLKYIHFYPQMSFKGVIAENTNFNGGLFQDIAFEENIFTGSTFAETSWFNCTFDACLLDHTQFIDFDFSRVELTESSLESALLLNGEAEDFRFFGSSILTESQIKNVISENTSFHNCLIDRVSFEDCQLSHATFSESHLVEAKFMNCGLQEADFTNTNCQHTRFDKVNLIQANFYMADITSSKLIKSNLYEVEFTEAIIGETKFDGSNLDNTILEHWRPGSWL